MFFKLAVIGTLCCNNVLANFTSYEGYKIYEFTAENTTQQKSLEILAQNEAYDSIFCDGTDGNRNFDFHWGEIATASHACASTFRGSSAFSEPETQAVRDLMHSLTGRAKFYLSLHSFGNYLIYPWGYTSALPKSWRDIDDIARTGAAAINTATGTDYTVGSTANVLYPAAGGSLDYALSKAKIPVPMAMELPSAGQQFDPPLSKIEELASETWIGIKAMAEKIMDKYILADEEN